MSDPSECCLIVALSQVLARRSLERWRATLASCLGLSDLALEASPGPDGQESMRIDGGSSGGQRGFIFAVVAVLGLAGASAQPQHRYEVTARCEVADGGKAMTFWPANSYKRCTRSNCGVRHLSHPPSRPPLPP